jgi:Leucine rich repeat
MTSPNAVIFSICFPNLVTLDARRCGIRNMDDLFQNDTLPNLKVLEVSKNALTSLKAGDLAGFVHLRKIDLSHNRINSVAWGIFGKLKNLKTVNLRGNKLMNLVLDANTGATCCHSITVLSLSKNRLTDVSNLKFFSGLQELYISDTSGLMLNTMPFEKIPNLIAISLSNNGLTNTTDLAILTQAKNLQFLGIANNNFGSLNLAKFPKLTKLVYINLLQQTVTAHRKLKNRFPQLKIVKMASNNWTCDYRQKVLNYLEVKHIQWMDKAVDTKQCPQMYTFGHGVLLIFAGLCATMVVVMVSMAWIICFLRKKLATNIDVPVQNIEEPLYSEIEEYDHRMEIKADKGSHIYAEV